MFVIRSILRAVLPWPVKTFIKKARVVALRGQRFYCPVCERGFRKFFEFGVNPHPNALFPGCGSLERHRIYQERRALVVTSYDDTKRGCITKGLERESVVDVKFLLLSQGRSMYDTIDLSAVASARRTFCVNLNH